MNTHETYVSLETAQLLKKAGFDWEVRYYYLNDSEIFIDSEYESMEFSATFYPKPTLSIAQKWLREVKKYHIYVRPYSLDDETYVTNIVVTDSIWGALQDDNKKAIIFKTYEEALEAGIKKALEMILEKGEY